MCYCVGRQYRLDGVLHMKDLQFKKSSYSVWTHCVEVQRTDNEVRVRDSKNPTGPTLTFNHDEWKAFRSGMIAGEFDL